MRNMFTVDVEEYFCVTAFEKVIPRSTWDHYPRHVEQNLEYLLDELSTYGSKGTFFILGWLAERQPDIVRKIYREGHEVASHGYNHRKISDQTTEEFAYDVRKTKRILEDIIGDSVYGYRAPSFSITKRTEWALEILAHEGYTYDSSVYPVFRPDYGIPNASREISNISLPSGRNILEIPLTCLQIPLCRIPVGGGAYLRWYPFAFTKWALERINTADRIPFTVYIHPWEIDENHPVVPGIGLFAKLRHHIGIMRNREKLRKLLTRFSFGSIREVLSVCR